MCSSKRIAAAWARARAQAMFECSLCVRQARSKRCLQLRRSAAGVPRARHHGFKSCLQHLAFRACSPLLPRGQGCAHACDSEACSGKGTHGAAAEQNFFVLARFGPLDQCARCRDAHSRGLHLDERRAVEAVGHYLGLSQRDLGPPSLRCGWAEAVRDLMDDLPLT